MEHSGYYTKILGGKKEEELTQKGVQFSLPLNILGVGLIFGQDEQECELFI